MTYQTNCKPRLSCWKATNVSYRSRGPTKNFVGVKQQRRIRLLPWRVQRVGLNAGSNTKWDESLKRVKGAELDPGSNSKTQHQYDVISLKGIKVLFIWFMSLGLSALLGHLKKTIKDQSKLEEDNKVCTNHFCTDQIYF